MLCRKETDELTLKEPWMHMKMKRLIWVIWYVAWYPFIRFIFLFDYIPRRLCRGWGVIFQKTGLLAGCWFSLAIIGLSLFGFPFLILWYLGRSTYNTDYVPKIERLHADFYAVK